MIDVNKNYTKRCRAKYSKEKWKHINQYYCRSWKSWVTRYTHMAIIEDKNKNRNSDIDKNYILDLLAAQDYRCAISGINLTHDKSLYSMSIDRIDNKRGHLRNNIQLILRGLNLAKNQANSIDLIELLDNIVTPIFIPNKISRDYVSSRIRSHRIRDCNKKMDCDIDTNFVLDLLNENNRCYFTGIKMACYKHPCFSVSIDRIDNGFGHTKDNIRLVLKSVNRAKRNYSDDEFHKWLKDIKNKWAFSSHQTKQLIK